MNKYQKEYCLKNGLVSINAENVPLSEATRRVFYTLCYMLCGLLTINLIKMEKIEEWNERVGIDWWREGRTQLNKVIRKYNKWIDKHSDNRVKTAKLLAKIDRHLEMDYCNQSGGSGWKDELLNMKSIVESKM